ncbi:hypothetical protein B0H13DRAFT_2365696 [Mycena leptocephala]|nr:hypothetical protein B0H13DRAFT_2365696 [Mycena leptocephala]
MQSRSLLFACMYHLWFPAPPHLTHAAASAISDLLAERLSHLQPLRLDAHVPVHKYLECDSNHRECFYSVLESYWGWMLAGWKSFPEGSQAKLQPLLGYPPCLIEVAIVHRVLVTWQCGALLMKLYRLFQGAVLSHVATLPPGERVAREVSDSYLSTLTKRSMELPWACGPSASVYAVRFGEEASTPMILGRSHWYLPDASSDKWTQLRAHNGL